MARFARVHYVDGPVRSSGERERSQHQNLSRYSARRPAQYSDALYFGCGMGKRFVSTPDGAFLQCFALGTSSMFRHSIRPKLYASRERDQLQSNVRYISNATTKRRATADAIQSTKYHSDGFNSRQAEFMTVRIEPLPKLPLYRSFSVHFCSKGFAISQRQAPFCSTLQLPKFQNLLCSFLLLLGLLPRFQGSSFCFDG